MSIAAAVLTSFVALPTMATDYVTTWTQDFNDASSYTANWTNGRPTDAREGTTADSGRCMIWSQETYTDADGAANTCFCLQSESTNGKISGSVYEFPAATFTSLGEYEFSFDIFLGGGFFSNRDNTSGSYARAIALKGTTLGDLVVFHTYDLKSPPSTQKSAKVFLAGDWDDSKTYWNDCDATKSDLYMAARGEKPNDNNQTCWHRVTITAVPEDGIYVAVVRCSDGATELANTRIGNYDTLSSISIVDKRGNGTNVGAFDNFVLKTPAAAGTPDRPIVTVMGDDDDDSKTVTLALADGAEAGTTLSYSFDGVTYTAYAEPIAIHSSTYVYAKATNIDLDSEVVQTYVIAGVLATPAGAITGVNGTSRTATFYSDYSLEYNTTAADGVYVDYSAPITVSDSTTFYVRAKKTSTVDANVTFYSAVLTFAVTAGEGSEVQLATPSLRRKGFGYVYVSASQADVISAPTADIHYTVNGGEEVTVPASVETYIPIDGKHGTTVTVWVEKDGFTASESATYTVDYSTVPANYKKVASVDIVGICRASNQGVSYSSDTINICDRDYHTSFAIGEGKLTDSESKIPMYFNKDIREGAGSRWNNNRENGLYCYSLAKYVAIKDLEAGDIIYANASSASASQNLSLRSSSDYEYFFNVVANGDVEMQFSASSYIYGICVYKKRKGFMLVIQ